MINVITLLLANVKTNAPEQLAAVYTYTKENPKKDKEAGYGCISYLYFP